MSTATLSGPLRDVISPMSFWTPRHLVESAWFEHAPFAFWIMDALRPERVVELGTHRGFSFFVFAEAASRLGFTSDVVALDSWEGDDQAGLYGEEVFESVREIMLADYSTVGRMLRGYFSESVAAFDDGSIDLLHIDGRHGYEDVKEDFELYLPKVSARGVVMFHDMAEHQDGFGVHRFWAEIASDYPSFSFEHGHGLGVLAVGTEVPASVTAFLASASESPELVRDTYAELGGRVSEQFYRTLGLQQQTERLENELAPLRHEVDAVRDRLDRATSELESLRASSSQTVAESAALASEVAALRNSTSWRVTAPMRAVTAKLRRPS